MIRLTIGAKEWELPVQDGLMIPRWMLEALIPQTTINLAQVISDLDYLMNSLKKIQSGESTAHPDHPAVEVRPEIATGGETQAKPNHQRTDLWWGN